MSLNFVSWSIFMAHNRKFFMLSFKLCSSRHFPKEAASCSRILVDVLKIDILRWGNMYLFHFCDWYHEKVEKIPIKTCILECLFSTIQFCEKLKIATCIFSLITPQQIMLQKSYAPRWKAVNISFPTAYAFFLSNDPFLRYKPLNQSHFF